MKDTNRARDPLVLLVEDDPAHACLLTAAVAETGVRARIERVKNAEEAEERLSDLSKERPALILVDLNLPGKSGREFLVGIKRDPRLQSLPVVVLSCSQAPEDVAACYRANANAYLVKPFTWEDLLRTVQVTLEFWLGVAVAPPARRESEGSVLRGRPAGR